MRLTARIWAPGLLILLIFAAWGALTAAEAAPPAPRGQSPNKWNLVFRDEFIGSSVKSDVWAKQFPWGSTSTTTPLLTYTPSNVFTKNGAVVLQARKNGSGSRPYTSGILTSKPMWKYGYFEMRAKLPKGKGMWPAFWLLPPNGAWPPEIDVMESVDQGMRTVENHFHYNDASGVHRDSGGSYRIPSSRPDLTEWHTFGMSWTPDAIRWYVDGVESRKAFTDRSVIPNMAMYLILNLQVGGSWPGNPDSTTPFPSNYTIDYVRVWKPL